MFKPGTLWDEICAVTERGLRSGVLQPIATECRFVQDGGVRFLVRVVDNLARKRQLAPPDGKQQGSHRNPFLPYDKDLYVGDASDTHICLLNKFNVVDHHLLIVTRCFEPQQSALTLEDFDALRRCMTEYDGLGFYNSGAIAGASQPHKHLQFVPLPLESDGPRFPVEPLLVSEASEASEDRVGQASSLAFRHALVRLGSDTFANAPMAAARMLEAYRELLQAIGADAPPGDNQVIGMPYNLLTTRQWMMIVPRTRESFESISFNSLAFVGALLVREIGEMKLLEDFGPMNALRHVTERGRTDG